MLLLWVGGDWDAPSTVLEKEIASVVRSFLSAGWSSEMFLFLL